MATCVVRPDSPAVADPALGTPMLALSGRKPANSSVSLRRASLAATSPTAVACIADGSMIFAPTVFESVGAPRSDAADRVALDVVRVFATYGVLVAHVASLVTRRYGELGVDYSAWLAAHCWYVAIIPTNLLFFLISGALMLGRNEPAWTFYKKRFIKIIPAWAFWSAFYIGWRQFYRGEKLDIQAAVVRLFDGDRGVAMYHLWFLNHMMKLYCFTPIFNSVFRDPDPTGVRILVALSYAVYIYQSLQQHVAGLHIFLLEWLSFLGFRTTVFLSGPTLRTMRPAKLVLGACGVLYLGAFVHTVVATDTITQQFGRMDEAYYHEFHAVFVMAMSSFLLVKALGRSVIAGIPQFARVFSLIAEHSFGIYLTHPAILDLLRNSLMRPDNTMVLGHPLWGVPLSVLVLGSCSMGFTMAIKRVPFFRQFVGG
eukprot:TRINITY_DN31477_c0_g1_i1.p1 TRINITY_DN31477_c0_g1~~TRINITY_DN31477_c0_g1_i1.p1  ORF type:complete len:427 (-),score=103.17 TRINITY_DN31477_c0_g1_i1:38-1318(-)